MTTLLQIHEAHFNARTGCFNSLPFAGMVAEQIRRYLKANTKSFDTRMVQVNGKKDVTIEFPRHRHVWWPKEVSAEAIRAEIEEVAALMRDEK